MGFHPFQKKNIKARILENFHVYQRISEYLKNI